MILLPLLLLLSFADLLLAIPYLLFVTALLWGFDARLGGILGFFSLVANPACDSSCVDETFFEVKNIAS